MFCPKCGTNLKDTDEFCSKCGTNLKKYKMGTANKTPEILDTNSAIDEGKTNTENNITKHNNNDNIYFMGSRDYQILKKLLRIILNLTFSIMIKSIILKYQETGLLMPA